MHFWLKKSQGEKPENYDALFTLRQGPIGKESDDPLSIQDQDNTQKQFHPTEKSLPSKT